jgi:hypothetical protein
MGFYLFWLCLNILFRIIYSQNAPRPVLGIVALQKDESLMLPSWLEYHSRIVPLENILVLDNFSEDPETLNILKAWKKKGLRVLYNQGPFAIKGSIISRAYHNVMPHVDIIIPLDADEFVVAFDGEQPVISKKKIYSYLSEFWNHSKYPCLALQQYYSNAAMRATDTLETIEYFQKVFYPRHDAKKIGRARDISKFDQRNREVFFPSCLDETNVTCHLPHACAASFGHVGLLHYHWVNPEVLARRAVRISIARGFFPPGYTLEKAKASKEMIKNMTQVHTDLNTPGFLELQDVWNYVSLGPTAGLPKTTLGMIKLETIPQFLKLLDNELSLEKLFDFRG